MINRRLTGKQRMFVDTYLSNGQNGADAYRTVYGTKASPQRAAEEASKLLRNPKIAPMLAKAHAQANAAVSHKLEITKQRIADGLADIAWPDDRFSVPVNVRRQALMDLGKLLGHIVEKREHRIIRDSKI